jgi:hypothetical protein
MGLICNSTGDFSLFNNNTDTEVYVFYTSNYMNVSNYTQPLQQVVGYAGGIISPGYLEMTFTEYIDQLSIST